MMGGTAVTIERLARKERLNSSKFCKTGRMSTLLHFKKQRDALWTFLQYLMLHNMSVFRAFVDPLVT